MPPPSATPSDRSYPPSQISLVPSFYSGAPSTRSLRDYEMERLRRQLSESQEDLRLARLRYDETVASYEEQFAAMYARQAGKQTIDLNFEFMLISSSCCRRLWSIDVADRRNLNKSDFFF